MADPITLTPAEQEQITKQRAALTDKDFSALLDKKAQAPVPTVKDIFGALLRTVFESVDSKKSLTGLITAVAAVLSLIAGKQGWSWLDPETAKYAAGFIVSQGALVIMAHMHVDGKVATASGANPTGGPTKAEDATGTPATPAGK